VLTIPVPVYKKFVTPAVECNEKTNLAGPGFKPGWVLGGRHRWRKVI